MYEVISLEKKGPIAIVTIDNPPMNPLNIQVRTELISMVRELEQDDDVVTLIIRGAGDKAFVAGADIKEFPQRLKKQQQSPDQESVFEVVANTPKPTIAMLNGYTLGGGLELALACDLRVAEDHVKVGFPEIKLGLLPGGGGTQRLPKIVGPSKAKEIMFTGSQIEAEEALALGLVTEVVPKGEGMEKAELLATKISRHSLQALSRIKSCVNVGEEQPLSESLQYERQMFQELFSTEDAKEGISAFIEKRRPVFTHK
ncbi:enoyl-CoA hydratase/isomerase family protein [Geomicrobium sp. JCM 19038]|uniref:enoyl-CoA hydratase/isomerase family protein n=1 Tax=Geomicrobium sp. JCM 19038 TaxID=1460635 RepID=UPI00045F3A23|nr:enoyl-CoA hydratase [Geomicrobium sp. JCM 19038]GAK07963.1 enoyl-CoA hydratase [Geomicrobium sp. JCM 19038]